MVKNASSYLSSDHTPKFEKHHFGKCLQRIKPFPKHIFIFVHPQGGRAARDLCHLTSGTEVPPLPPAIFLLIPPQRSRCP